MPDAIPTPAAFLDSLPPWASALVRAVNAKQANTFVLHGVPADLVPVRGPSGLTFLSLDDFLVQQLFAGWPSIVTYNRAEGLGFATPAARGHFQDRLRAYDAVHGTNWADSLPRDAANCFALLDSYFRDIIAKTQQNWRVALSAAIEYAVAAPAFSASLGYFDSYRSARLPSNLLQAQRDFFGAHTYERVDKPGVFHTNWMESGDQPKAFALAGQVVDDLEANP